jgi:hypothetical protein
VAAVRAETVATVKPGDCIAAVGWRTAVSSTIAATGGSWRPSSDKFHNGNDWNYGGLRGGSGSWKELQWSGYSQAVLIGTSAVGHCRVELCVTMELLD